VLSVSINPGGVSHVRVGEQNQENDMMWPGDYADQLEMKIEGGAHTITHPDADLELDGWLRCFPERASARDEWSRCHAWQHVTHHLILRFTPQAFSERDAVPRMEDVVKEDGVYSSEVAAALQVPRVMIVWN
jgi:hypothetical protein